MDNPPTSLIYTGIRSETSRYCNKKKTDEIKFLSLFHCSFDKKFQCSIDKKTNSHKTYFYNSIGNAKKKVAKIIMKVNQILMFISLILLHWQKNSLCRNIYFYKFPITNFINKPQYEKNECDIKYWSNVKPILSHAREFLT